MRRVFAAILPALVLVVLVGQLAFAQSKMVDLPTWQAEEPGTGEWWRALAAAFEQEHPGVQVRISGVTPSGRHADQMAIRLAAGDPPGILHLPAARAREFAQEGWLQPLDEFLAESDIATTWTPLQSFLEVDGTTYGVLLLGYTLQLFYNERLLNEAGVSVPTTPEEFIQAMHLTTKDTNGDGRIDQFGFVLPTTDAYNFYLPITAWVVGAGGHWTQDGAITANSPEVMEALGWLKDAFANEAIPQGLNVPQARQLFFEGKAAMMIDGPWLQANIEQAAPPEVAPHLKVAPLPFPYYAGGASNSIHIAKDLSPEDQALAWAFIELLARPQWQREYARLAQLPPPRVDALEDADLQEMPLIEYFMQGVDEAINFMPPGYEEQASHVFRIVADELNRMAVIANVTPEQAAQSIQRQLEAILSR